MDLRERIESAEKRIRPYIYETPLEKSVLLSEKYKTNLFLKCENFQKTGSFKFRGALNKILSLSEAEKKRGIITASTGNHGQGVALAAQIANIKSTIYVPKDASPIKLEAISTLGANIELCDGDCLHAEIQAREIASRNDVTFISPYNDIDVMAGQGSVGIELLRQSKSIDAVFISVGGGGLVSGIGSYLKAVKPDVEIVGCWPENAPAMSECIKAGKIFNVQETETISDGTAGGVEKGEITFPICQTIIDQHVRVSEEEIKTAMREIAEYERMIVEGSAGVAFAAFVKNYEHFKHKNIAIVLCGRNIAFTKFMEATR